VRIKGRIEPEAFERAAATLMTRHPILGSRLEPSDGEPLQWQVDTAPSFKLLDTENLNYQLIDRLLSEEADAPVDLFSENPFRVVLAPAATDRAFLLLTGHHIFLDGVALPVLLGEYLSLTQDGGKHEATISWDSGARSFLSYAGAEQQMISDGSFSRMTQYWAEQHSESDPTLHLSARGPEPATQSRSAVSFTIEQDSFQKFSERARKLQVSHFALASTAVFHALREVTGQDRIAFTTIVDTRRPPFDRTIGNFAGLHLMKQDAKDGGMSDEAVRTVFEGIIKAIADYVPPALYANEIERLSKRLEKEFSLTETVVQYLPTRSAVGRAYTSHGYEVAPVRLTARAQSANTPYYGLVLNVAMIPQPNSLSGWMTYEKAIVGSDTAQSIADLIQLSLEA
jgi:hypothetical protein